MLILSRIVQIVANIITVLKKIYLHILLMLHKNNLKPRQEITFKSKGLAQEPNQGSSRTKATTSTS